MMTSFKREPSADPSSGSQCFDPLETFINYDQTVVPTPSISPLSSRSKSVSTPTSSSSQQNNLIPIQPTPQTFAGPSHQYGQYRQQAGLPVGALANTFAVNQGDQFGYGRDQLSFGMLPPTDGYFGLNTADDFLDYGNTSTQSSAADMDIDFGSPTDLSMSNSSFVDPAAIGGQESTSHTQSTQSHPARVYPGMHQEAALAKAQAEAARAQQPQILAQQHKTSAATSSRQTSRNGSHTRPPTDPIVEESISRLLNQMRHSSVASSNDDDAATPNANGNQSHTRTRKDEEDMDEDERLLASEEGKKLSSKERRQLRNKVSARAFRSRRKEYIGQLEGEIAAKQSEADALRVKNEELTSENTRLTDLTRMLLSSPAFSTFLNDLSGVPASLPEPARLQDQSSALRLQTATSHKDVNPNQVTPGSSHNQQQNNVHVGLTMIPEESSFDYTANDGANTGYNNTNLDFGGLYDAQVYAVTAIPQGPAVDSIDFSMLHGKRSNFVGLHSEVDNAKDEPLAIESMPAVEKPEILEPAQDQFEEDVDVTDPSLILFIDQPSPSPLPTLSSVAPEDSIFGEIELEKAFSRVELVIDQTETPAEIGSATIERFERLCSRLEASSIRVAAVTGR